MPGNNGAVNEHNQLEPSLFFLFLQENKGNGLTGGQTAFSAMRASSFKPYTGSTLQSTSLCVHIIDREALRGKAVRKHTVVLLLQPVLSHSL